MRGLSVSDLFDVRWLRGLGRTAQAYRETFTHDGEITRAGTTVLADLAEFCAVGRTTTSLDEQGRVDPLAMAIREGRREAYLRILEYLRPGRAVEVQRRLMEAANQETTDG